MSANPKSPVIRHALRWRAGESADATWPVVGDAELVQYLPMVEDMVIGVVVDKHTEGYKLDIRSHFPAVLPALAFEGATKRNRPHLEVPCCRHCPHRSRAANDIPWNSDKPAACG
jgi:hypothetical protein